MFLFLGNTLEVLKGKEDTISATYFQVAQGNKEIDTHTNSDKANAKY